MALIHVHLVGTELTTESLHYFKAAIEAASGHSGQDFPITVDEGRISCTVPAYEED